MTITWLPCLSVDGVAVAPRPTCSSFERKLIQNLRRPIQNGDMALFLFPVFYYSILFAESVQQSRALKAEGV